MRTVLAHRDRHMQVPSVLIISPADLEDIIRQLRLLRKTGYFSGVGYRRSMPYRQLASCLVHFLSVVGVGLDRALQGHLKRVVVGTVADRKRLHIPCLISRPLERLHLRSLAVQSHAEIYGADWYTGFGGPMTCRTGSPAERQVLVE